MTFISKLWGKSSSATATAEVPSHGARSGEQRVSGPLDYCRLLTQDSLEASEADLDRAWKSIRENMSLVPGGEVMMAATDPEAFCDITSCAACQVAAVQSCYLARYCGTES